MPSNALLGVLICVGVETVVCLAALYFRRKRAKGEARTVVNLANLLVVLIFFQVLSNYLEGGYFVSTPIMLFIVISTACFWASKVSEVSFSFFFVCCYFFDHRLHMLNGLSVFSWVGGSLMGSGFTFGQGQINALPQISSMHFSCEYIVLPFQQ